MSTDTQRTMLRARALEIFLAGIEARAFRIASIALANEADIAIARTGDGRQPVFALLRRSTLPALTAYLQQGRRKADGWYSGLRVAEVDFEDGAAFCNINYSDDLASLNAGTGPF